MNLKGRSVSIIGAARSGLAAAKSLVECEARIFISDIQKRDRLEMALKKAELSGLVEYEAEGHSKKVLESDFIVLSPGVRSDIPILIEAEKMGIPVYSEIEIAYRLSKGKRLVVTGSNGKTTTTTLLAEFCRSYFPKVFLGGNIGIPVMEFATQTTQDSLQVLEVSSFQLETISEFRPDIGVITNFFENHLDRYPSYKAYMDAKKRIALNMNQHDWLVLNAGQSAMHEMAHSVSCRIAWFGWNIEDIYPSVTIKDDYFVYKNEHGEVLRLFSVESPRLPGRHNHENIMCACLTALLAGVEPELLESVVKRFAGVEHRLEWVRELDGITFINDSKGTNCAASITALKACEKPVVLIAGGRDKGTDLSEWVEAVKAHCRGVVLYGEARKRFRSALEGLAELKIASSFEDAVEKAYKWGKAGDVVLLSPACSSYDLFADFEQRGRRFKELVHRLGNDK